VYTPSEQYSSPQTILQLLVQAENTPMFWIIGGFTVTLCRTMLSQPVDDVNVVEYTPDVVARSPQGSMYGTDSLHKTTGGQFVGGMGG
jgi:hypothetical protein